MDRRTFAAAMSSLATVGIAGCSSVGSDLDEIEYDGEKLVAFLDDGHDIGRLEVLSETDERIYTTNVGTETRIELFNVVDGRHSFDADTDTVDETLTIRAVDSDGEISGEADVNYAPEIEIEDFDIEFREGDIKITLTNIGQGPVNPSTHIEFDPMEIRPEHEVISDDEVFEFPDFELTDVRTGLDEPDSAVELLSGGETQQVLREAEPLVSDVTVDAGEFEASGPNLYTVQTNDEIVDEEIPLNRSEATVGFTVDVDTEPTGLEENFEGEIEFSGLTAHRNSGDGLLSVYSYTIQVVADTAEIVSFEGKE